MRLSAALALCVTLAATPASGQEAGDRCRLLGPIAVSFWVGFVETLGQADRAETRAAADTLQSIVALYEGMACPADALQATLDCLTHHMLAGSRPEGAEPGQTALAEACMAEARLPEP